MFGGAFFGGSFFGATAGRPTRISRPRFIARHKGEYHEFLTNEELEEFVEKARAELAEQPKPKKKKKPRLTVTVEPEFQEELYSYDLPSIQPMFDRGAFEEVQRLLARFEMLKAQRFDDDDEEALLLLL